MRTVVPKLEFKKSWKNVEDFPTHEPNETKVREDLQCLHDEVKDYLNTTVQPLLQRVSDSVPSSSDATPGAFLCMQPDGPAWVSLTDVSEVGA